MNILASMRLLSGYSWAAISHDFIGIRVLVDALIAEEIKAARDSGELPAGFKATSVNRADLWRLLEQKLFRKYSDIIEFENSLDADKVGSAMRRPIKDFYREPYFATGKWRTDTGPKGKKFEEIVVDYVWDHF